MGTLRFELDPHQAEAHQAVVEVFRRSSRASVIAACGSGKTLIGLRVAEEYPRNLILEPSLGMIRQALQDARDDGLLVGRRVICVCSDKTVAEHEDQDEWTVSEADLGVPVTTDTATLRRLLEDSGERCVVFCTYHSQPLLQSALPFGYQFDCGIFDEAHRTAGERDRAFTVALNDAQIPIKKRLFFTATRRLILDNKDDYRGPAYSMDDESIYGPVAYELSLPEAIRRNIVCDIDILVASATDEEVRSTLQNAPHLLTPHKRIPVELVAGQIAVVRSIQSTGVRRVVSFHQTIARAAAFAKDSLKVYRSAGVIPFHIRGDMPDSQRRAVIEAFLSVDRPSVLTNCRCLAEGIDVPDIDMVTFMDRKRSPNDVVQAMGRAQRKRRKGRGKERGFVMLPLYVHQDEPLEPALERSDMAETWEILNTVLEFDGILANRLKRTSASGETDSMAGRRPTKKRERVIGPANILTELQRAIAIRRIKRLSDRWDVMFQAAEQYAAREGNLNVPLEHLEDELPLGRWLAKQVYLKTKGGLVHDRANRLLALGAWVPRQKGTSQPHWSSPVAWERHLALARAFLEQHGHLNVPATEDNALLHDWVSKAKRALLMNRLTEDKRSALLSLGIEPAASESTQAGIKKLTEWRSKNPKGRPDRRGPDRALYYSLAYLRQKHRSGQLNESELNALAAINLDPRTFHARGKTTYQQFGEKSWDMFYEQLKSYTEKHGWTGLWRTERVGGLNLQGWVVYQRHLKRKAVLSPQRVAALEELGIHWDRKTEWWVPWVEKLESFYREHGHLRLPNTTEFAPLAQKVAIFRNRWTRGVLPPAIQTRLTAIQFPRSAEEARFQWGIHLLQEWRAVHGSKALARSDLPDRLRFFLENSRRRFVRNELPESQVNQLAEFGVPWATLDSTAVTMISRLAVIKKRVGKANVEVMAQQEPDLHTWVEDQMEKAAKSELTPDFLAELRKVGLDVGGPQLRATTTLA
jgi:superfamily II DNA or RNA helicase